MLAYFDCFSGISGDMTLGALIDLGVPVAFLKDSIRALPLKGFDITVAGVEYNGISAQRVTVETTEDHPHRRYADIRKLIESSPLPGEAKEAALAIFRRLAEAEAAVHGCSPEEVHFHEVGGVDAIVDVVGTALGMAHLGITEAMSAPVPTGRGFVDCSHGRLPVPAPATLALLKGIPIFGGEAECELTTPTGAAIVSTVSGRFGPMPEMVVSGIGYGAGRRNLVPGPNVLRLVIGEGRADRSVPECEFNQDRVMVIESNIDNMNPEFFGFVMERLFEKGALDVAWIPVHMKKNRPGTMLQVLCRPAHLHAMVRCILSETTSLGVRCYEAGRYFVEREQIMLESSFGRIPFKRIRYPQGEARVVPEFEVCRRIALEKGMTLRSVYDLLNRETIDGRDPGR